MLRHLDIVLLHVILTNDNLIEDILELVIFEEAHSVHLILNHINFTEKDLEYNELLDCDTGVFLSQCSLDLLDLHSVLLNVCSGQV